jgi:predicted nuclease of predicted toxin-antitoxin system
MPLRFVLDENLRGPLWRAIVGHNNSSGGIDDRFLFSWAEREERIIVTNDKDATKQPAYHEKHRCPQVG